MKRFVFCVLMALACMPVLCACSAFSHAIHGRQEHLNQIRTGMTGEEVRELAGNPDFKRFENDVEQWEYRKAFFYEGKSVTMLVDFVGGRVTAVNQFLPEELPVAEPQVMVPVPPQTVVVENAAFQRLCQRMTSEPFADDRMKLLQREAPLMSLTVDNCARLMQFFDWDNERLRCVQLLLPSVVDLHNGHRLEAHLDFDSSKEKLRRMLTEAGDSADYLRCMDARAFEDFFARYEKTMLESERRNLLENTAHVACFTCGQCARLLGLYSFDSDKMEVLQLMVSALVDYREAAAVIDSFEWNENRDKAARMLKEHRPQWAR